LVFSVFHVFFNVLPQAGGDAGGLWPLRGAFCILEILDGLALFFPP